jgi:hypothetical protein
MWFNLAAAGENKTIRQLAIKARDKLARLMSPAQIEQAQAMAQTCMSSNFTRCGD